MEVGKKQRGRKNECFGCGEILDGLAGVGTDEPPEAGNLSICVYCGDVAVFDDQGALRRPTDEEQAEIAKDELILQMISMVKLRQGLTH